MNKIIRTKRIKSLVILFFLLGSISCGVYGKHILPEQKFNKEKIVEADWTILVFMNGDNNLEQCAIDNFKDMAKVGSSDKVNIIVQFDRFGSKKYTSTQPDWSQTLRFRVLKNMEPLPKYAVEDIGEANMGDGKVLRDFVLWGMKKYPAKHFMLDIWDHGNGYRFMTANAKINQTIISALMKAPENKKAFDNYKLSDNALGLTSNIKVTLGDPFRSSNLGPYKSCSNDETNNDELYNREIQDNLTNGLDGAKIDLLGFDCCLMSMIETTYAMRNVAKIFVGSEELEPGAGWRYDDWLQTLKDSSLMEAKELGKVLVMSYEKAYSSNDPSTTMAAIDLSNFEDIARVISDFSNSLITYIRSEIKAIQNSRNSCFNYAPQYNRTNPFYHVDFIRFCQLIIENANNQDLKNKAKLAMTAVAESILLNYKGASRQDEFGSFGLAIYFPPSKSSYKSDIYAKNGYEKSNSFFPVEFVQNHKWTDFLHTYFKYVK